MSREAAVVAACVMLAVPAAALDPDRLPSQYGHDSWEIEDGLPQNSVRAIAQTPDGYLWLATAEGLARFDGVRFVTFDRRNTAVLPDNAITALAPQADGVLWIGTEAGVVRRAAGAFAPVSHPVLDGMRITALLVDRRSRVWVGTARSGLVRLDDLRRDARPA